MGSGYRSPRCTMACLALALSVFDSDGRLTALDPVAVGHIREIVGAIGGRPREIRTLSTDPPVFLVPDLLSESEVEELIALAEFNRSSIWEKSNVATEQSEIFKMLKKGGKAGARELRRFDEDGDNRLNEEEMFEFVRECFHVVDYDSKTHAAFVSQGRALGDAKDLPDGLTLKTMQKMDLYTFFRTLVKDEPHRLDRYSHQRWLTHEAPLLQTLLSRAQSISGLPRAVIDKSEELQLVRYPVLGHYSCHHDSSPDLIAEGHIRIATLGIFLNEPESGGELAFPAALRGKETEAWGQREFNHLEAACQPTQQCTRLGGLIVKPRRGDAVFWYNVHRAGWNPSKKVRSKPGFGDKSVIFSSMHCGARVLKGEKLFANLWMHATSADLTDASEEL